MRPLLLTLAAWLMLCVASAGAQAQTPRLMDEEDAVELAQLMAEASDEQGVCYGWNVSVREDVDDGWFDTKTSNYAEVGSNFGPSTPLEQGASCPKWVALEGSIHWTAESSEDYDSSEWRITSGGLQNPPTKKDVERLIENTSLDEDEDDVIWEAMNVLPLLVAENGEADYLPFEPASEVAPSDRTTDPPGDDFERTHGLARTGAILVIVLGGLILLVGLGWALFYRDNLGGGSRSRHY